MAQKEEINILVIEDEMRWQEIYNEILEGYIVDLVDNYDDAISKLKEAYAIRKYYDLAIVDLNLPKKSGEKASFEVGENIVKYIFTELNPRPKVLMTTSRLDIPPGLIALIENPDLGDEFKFLGKGSYSSVYDSLKDYVRRLLHDKIYRQDLWKFGGNIPNIASGLNGTLKRILTQAMDITGSNIAHILFPVGNDILKIYVGTGQDPIEYEIPLHKSLTGKALLSRNIINISNTDIEEFYIKPPGADQQLRSELAIPLINGEKVIGVLNLESEQINNYDAFKEKISSTFADLLIITLLNEQRRREVDVSRILLDEVLISPNIQKTIVEQGAKYLGAQIGGIMMIKENKLLVESTYPEDLIEKIDKNGFLIDDCVSGLAIKMRKIINVKDIKSEEPYNKIYKSFGMEMKSEIVAPIEIKGKIIGVLNFEHAQRSFFTEYDEGFLADLAKQTAAAMEKDVLLRQLSEKTTKQMEERLIGEITHRLTNPLGAIRAWIIEIEKKYNQLLITNFDLNRYFSIIKNNSIKAMELIGQIKDEQGKIYAESIDIMEHIILAKQDEKIANRLNDIDIMISPLNQKIFVRADNELWRVFVNFIENSIDALTNGEKKIEIVISESDKIVNVQISDTGKGIPPDNKLDIFKPWYSSKEGIDNLHGMGLPWVKKYIETYGGSIDSVESVPQKGTNIKFSLLRVSQDSTMIERLLIN